MSCACSMMDVIRGESSQGAISTVYSMRRWWAAALSAKRRRWRLRALDCALPCWRARQPPSLRMPRQALDRARLSPVYDMRVYGDAHAELHFSAFQAAVPELAWIVESSLLEGAL